MIALCSFIILTLLILWIHLTLKKKYSYWKNLNIPHLKPWPIVGNYADYLFLKKTMGETTKDICEAFPGEPLIGVYFGTEPALIVQDPELVKQVTITDFATFNSRDNMDYIHRELISTNVFFSYGDRWKVLRQNLSPLFSTSKMKQMFYLIERCTKSLEKVLEEEMKSNNVVEISDLTKRYTLASMGACVFDVDAHSIENKEQSAFVKMGDVVMERSVARALFWAFRCMWPWLFYGIGLTMLPTFIWKIFSKFMRAIYERRDYKPTGKNDFIDLILQMWNNKFISGEGFDGKKLSLEVDENFLVSQGLTFFGAGFETSAGTLTFTLYELAKSPDDQRRAAQEVDEYLRKRSGKVDFSCVNDLPWTWACVLEAIRLYPVLGTISREAVCSTMLGNVRLRRTERILLPVLALHRSCNDPEVYQPRRFIDDPAPGDRPPVFMPFGEGPRTCIGMRFAKMQVMACIVTILKSYHVELAEGTPTEMSLSTKSIPSQPRGAVNLKFLQRKGHAFDNKLS